MKDNDTSQNYQKGNLKVMVLLAEQANGLISTIINNGFFNISHIIVGSIWKLSDDLN
jgi:hypothetical protein